MQTSAFGSIQQIPAQQSFKRICLVIMPALILASCAHGPKSQLKDRAKDQSQEAAADEKISIRPQTGEGQSLEPLSLAGPVELRLKADPKRVEKVNYFHRSRSRSFEDNQVRTQNDETLEFSSLAETVKVDPAKDRFTQIISTQNKDGSGDLNDFAMPEIGEKLEVTANSRGRILKSGDYPQNSIFYVAPISLPENPVNIGDTWTMQSSWLSLGEMVPYQLDMVSILKGFWKCGKDACAEIEISGEVGLQGSVAQAMSFKSLWRGRIFFDMDAGTVVWSRVNSDESFASGNVRREVDSCLEAVLMEPVDEKINGIGKPTCVGMAALDAPASPPNSSNTKAAPAKH